MAASLAAIASLLFLGGSAQGSTLPAGFQESTVLSGLTNPTQIKFSPDGRVFVAEKSGLIKVFDNLSDTTPTTFADLRTKVHNFWDRGLLGMELAPNFPSDPYVYVLYAHDAAIGGTAPRWGTAGATSDGCPTPPGPTADGCVVSGRLSRLEAAGNVMTGSEQVLIEDWCQQYPSHSVGDLEFGADGKLYVTAGDGASFNFADYGQDGQPLNPCGDPPGGVGATLTPPNAEGGALRSQDVRTGGSGGGGGGTGATHLLRPNADVTAQWNLCCSGVPAWDTLNENVTHESGAIPVEDFIYESVQGRVTEVALSSAQLSGATVASGKAWFYMDAAPGQTVTAQVIWGGSVRASKTISGGASGLDRQWHSIEVAPPDQAAVDDLRVRYTVSTAGSSSSDVFATYFELKTAATAGGGSSVLRPNTDVTSQWTPCCDGAATAWTQLDENVTQADGDIPVEHFLYESAQGDVTEVGLSSVQLAGATPQSGKAWFYLDVAPGQTIKADVVWGGSVRATRTISGGASGLNRAWYSIDALPPDQAAIDDLRLRFTISTAGASTTDLFAAYFDLTSSAPPSGDPTGLDGTVLRVDPATGAGLPDNPHGSSPDPNTRRMVAYGLRNPFRFAIRPGTNEVWLGDVGWNTWEEINRVTNPTDGSLDNFGWPCYEGTGRQSGYDSADLNLCESLYTTPNITAPYYAWNHASKVVTGETCPTGGSSAAGVDFYTGGSYPDNYDGAMFFADYSRDCIWAMMPQGGLPNPSQLITFAAGAANPVDVAVGPGGDVYYPDFDGGAIRRISYAAANQAPTAAIQATPTSGAAPLNVQFNGGGSSDPDPGDSLTYAWDLDADGAFDDSTAVNPTRTYTAGSYLVKLRVTDESGATDTEQVTITAGNAPPQATITAPSSSLLWQVGQQVSFAATATDAQDGNLGASRFSWQLDLNHCPSTCHVHTIQTFPGVASGSFIAPDHEYPSSLTLRLTVTDSGGLTDTEQVLVNPATVALTLATTNPTGLQLTLNGQTATTPFTRTVIRGSNNSISAPTPQTKSGRNYAFSSWSDGGARTHNITANASTTYTANFRRIFGASASSKTVCTNKAKRKKKKKKKRKRC